MNKNYLTTVGYNDPLPQLGKKVVKPPVLGRLPGEQDWIADRDRPGFQRNVRDGKLRTNVAVPEEAIAQTTQAAAPPTLKPYDPSKDGKTIVQALSEESPLTANQTSAFEKIQKDLGSLAEKAENWMEMVYGAAQAVQPDVFIPGVTGIPSSFGWRKDKPTENGLYYSTNSEKFTSQVDTYGEWGPKGQVKGFGFTRYFKDGLWFTNEKCINTFGPEKNQDIYWHARPVTE